MLPAPRSRRSISKPSMPGKTDVEDHQIRGAARRDLEALFAVARDGDLVTLLLEGVLDPARDGVLVFDDEDRCGHSS